MSMRRGVKWLSLLAAILLLGIGVVFWLESGGEPELVPTPNLYADSAVNPFEDVPVEFRNNQVDVLYVTDRQRVDAGAMGKVAYDHRRSTSMAFGSAVIQYGRNITWDELVKASRSRRRDVSLPRELVKVEEKWRFPPTPWPFDPQADWTDHRLHPIRRSWRNTSVSPTSSGTRCDRASRRRPRRTSISSSTATITTSSMPSP
jgi:hypothetical protein